MKLKTLEDLLVHDLQDLYDAENQLVKALPKMAAAANNAELKAGFERHLAETEAQVERLERAFEALGQSAERKTCAAMKGLIAEGQEAISEDAEPSVKDAALIGAAQRVEHYEIAGYGTAKTYARLLGHSDVERLLQETLAEEEATDKRLTLVAEKAINIQAMQGR